MLGARGCLRSSMSGCEVGWQLLAFQGGSGLRYCSIRSRLGGTALRLRSNRLEARLRPPFALFSAGKLLPFSLLRSKQTGRHSNSSFCIYRSNNTPLPASPSTPSDICPFVFFAPSPLCFLRTAPVPAPWQTLWWSCGPAF